MNIQTIFYYVFYTNFANKFIFKFVNSYHTLHYANTFFLLCSPMTATNAAGTCSCHYGYDML